MFSFRIPYYAPGIFEPGKQITNFGQGGPSSHPRGLLSQPQSHPTVYAVRTYGLGDMPRFVMGPTPVVEVNALSNPITQNNLIINGLYKT
jgi:hypothetical protein